MPTAVYTLTGFRTWRRDRRVLKEARLCLAEAKRGAGHLPASDPSRAAIRGAADELADALEAHDGDRIRRALVQLDDLCQHHLAPTRKSTLREYAESVGVAVVIALLLRAFVVEAFKIPSCSMIPTLQVGDHIFVSKFQYGFKLPFIDHKVLAFSKPKRGDVIVFKYPIDPSKDFIKRVIATEGDWIEVKPGQDGDPVSVWVNDQPVERRHINGACRYLACDEDEVASACEWRTCQQWDETVNRDTYETIYNGAGDRGHLVGPSYARTRVPPGMVFVMGDNRDNSNDSRYWGFVPLDNVKGKALIVWWSADDEEGIRWSRMLKLID